MEYIYGAPPPPPSSSSNQRQTNENHNKRKQPHSQNNNIQKKQKKDENKNQDYLDLPTHLPNMIPSKPVQEEEVVEEESISATKKPKEEPVPVFGTNIVLKTDEDIEEWIKQRKLNWMKKISNSRPEPEKKEQPEKNHNRRDSRQNKQTQNQKSNSGPYNNNAHRDRKPNLNKLIIQREIHNENIAILDVIKELFDQNILKK